MAASVGPNAGIWSGWIPGESGWGAHMDANLRFLDAAMISFTVAVAPLNAPPGSPTVGDRYIIGDTPSGAWAAHAKALAVYDTDESGVTAWEFFTPKEGWTVSDLDADTAVLPKTYLFRGGAWAVKAEVASVVGKTGAVTAADLITGGLSDLITIDPPGAPGLVGWDGTNFTTGTLGTMAGEALPTGTGFVQWDGTIFTAGTLALGTMAPKNVPTGTGVVSYDGTIFTAATLSLGTMAPKNVPTGTGYVQWNGTIFTASTLDLGTMAPKDVPTGTGIVSYDGSVFTASTLGGLSLLDMPDPGIVISDGTSLDSVSALQYSQLPAEVSYLPLSVFHPGPLDDDERVLFWAADQDVLIPAGFIGSRIVFDGNDPSTGLPTSGVSLGVDIKTSGTWASIGSFTVDTGGTLGVVSAPTADLALLDTQGIRIVGPSSHDGTFGDFSFTFRLKRASVSDIIASESNAYTFGTMMWGAGSSAQVGTLRIEPDSDFAAHITKLEFDNGVGGGTLVAQVLIGGTNVVFNVGTTTDVSITIGNTGTATVFSDGAVSVGDNIDVLILSIDGLINDGGVIKVKGTLDP